MIDIFILYKILVYWMIFLISLILLIIYVILFWKFKSFDEERLSGMFILENSVGGNEYKQD